MLSLDPVVERWFLIAGWSAIVVLWHTTVVALAYATWGIVRPTASARGQYLAGGVALVAIVLLAAATPIALTSVSHPAAVVSVRFGSPSAALPLAVSAAPFPISLPGGPGASHLAAWIGAAWLLGSVVALVRLAGGWMLARRIRRGATPVPSSVLATAMADVSATWRLPSAVLLTSPHVEAPVVLGHRAPVILLPHDAAQHFDADAILPLIAHELAHVARHDYAANLAQSLAEALLFFSPGVHWLSRRVREAREYCCDDLVVAQCGPRPYVEALTILAGLGAAARARPVLNVVGPRLIVRIRRLLQEDTMPSFRTLRIAGLIGALGIAVFSGRTVVPASAAAVADATVVAAGRLPEGGVIAPSFVPVQPGSSVALESVVASGYGVCGTATVHNKADVAVTGMLFIAAVERYAPRPSGSMEMTDVVPVDIAPDATAAVGIDLVSIIEQKILSRGGRSPTVMCAILEVQFANGARWRMTPNRSAITIDDLLGLPKPQLPRALVGAPSASGNPNLCVDEGGLTYSSGALIEVRYEPGRFAKCANGQWIDATSRDLGR